MNVLKKIGIGAGYVLFFVLCTVLFVRFLFPTRQAKEFAALKLAEATGAETVTIRDLGITGLIPSGVELEGLEMTLPGVKKKTTERNGSVIGDKRQVSIEKLTADVESISGLLDGAPDVSFELAMGGGTLQGGHYRREKGGPHTLKIDKIDGIAIGPEQLFQTLVGMDIQGIFSGKVDLTIPTDVRDGKEVMAFDQMAGTVELQLANAIAIEPIVELAGAREKLTDIELGEIRIGLTAEANSQAAAATAQTGDGKPRPPSRRGDGTIVTLDEASALGGDISVASQKGSLTFVQGGTAKEARLNIHLAVKPEDSFYDKEVEDPANPDKKLTPNKRLKTGLEMGMKNKLVDGQIGIAITGTIGDPKVMTEKPRTRVTASGSSTTSSRKMNIDQPGDDGDGDGEEKPSAAKPTREPPTREPPPSRDNPSDGAARRNPPATARAAITKPMANRPMPVVPPEPVEPEHVEPEPLEPEHVDPGVHPEDPQPDPNALPVEGEPGEPGEDPGIDPNAPIEEPLPQ